MGFHYRSHLLCHAGSRRCPWVDRIGGTHGIFGLRFISPSGILFDPYFLRVAEAEEERLKEAAFG